MTSDVPGHIVLSNYRVCCRPTAIFLLGSLQSLYYCQAQVFIYVLLKKNINTTREHESNGVLLMPGTTLEIVALFYTKRSSRFAELPQLFAWSVEDIKSPYHMKCRKKMGRIRKPLLKPYLPWKHWVACSFF